MSSGRGRWFCVTSPLESQLEDFGFLREHRFPLSVPCAAEGSALPARSAGLGAEEGRRRARRQKFAIRPFAFVPHGCGQLSSGRRREAELTPCDRASTQCYPAGRGSSEAKCPSPQSERSSLIPTGTLCSHPAGAGAEAAVARAPSPTARHDPRRPRQSRRLHARDFSQMGRSERAQRSDVSDDRKFVLVPGTEPPSRWRTVPIVSGDQGRVGCSATPRRAHRPPMLSRAAGHTRAALPARGMPQGGYG